MISVIIPTLNEEKALPATLDHMLSQAGDYEVIVVDGGNTDRTCEIVRATSDRFLQGCALMSRVGLIRLVRTTLLATLGQQTRKSR